MIDNYLRFGFAVAICAFVAYVIGVFAGFRHKGVAALVVGVLAAVIGWLHGLYAVPLWSAVIGWFALALTFGLGTFRRAQEARELGRQAQPLPPLPEYLYQEPVAVIEPQFWAESTRPRHMPGRRVIALGKRVIIC